MASSRRSRISVGMPASKAATPPLVPALTMYIATSALRISSAAVVDSSALAIPMLAETETLAPSIRYGALSSRASRSAIARDCRRSGESWVRMANSSPPRRANTSLPRMSDSMRRATATSSASPAANPWVSLKALKSSRSMNRTDDVRVPRLPPLQNARWRPASNVRRLATP